MRRGSHEAQGSDDQLAAGSPTLTTQAVDGLTYIDAEGVSQSVGSYMHLTGGAGGLTSDWYAVKGSVWKDNVWVADNAPSVVNIVLCDGATLSTNGVTIANGKTLRIWCQSSKTGKLKTSKYGIRVQSGRTLEINGGVIVADTSESGHAGIGGKDGQSAGTITINGGDITAWGTINAAGIGGGNGGKGGTITINGGKVWAKSDDEDGAGIGGGDEGGGGIGRDNKTEGITITGGKVEATGGKYAAGIGSGDNSSDKHSGGVIKISGNVLSKVTDNDGNEKPIYSTSVKATGGEDGAGIGGGDYSESGNITITGAYVEAKGIRRAAGIGGSCNAKANTIKIQASPQGSPAYVVATGDYGAGIGTGAADLMDDDPDRIVGGTIDISNSIVVATSVLGGAGIGGGIFGHVDSISISGGQTAAQDGVTVAPGTIPWLYIAQKGGAVGLEFVGDVVSDIAGQSAPGGALSEGANGLFASIGQAISKLWDGLIGLFTSDPDMIFYTGAGIGGGYHAPGGTITVTNDAVIQATAGMLPPTGASKIKSRPAGRTSTTRTPIARIPARQSATALTPLKPLP